MKITLSLEVLPNSSIVLRRYLLRRCWFPFKSIQGVPYKIITRFELLVIIHMGHPASEVL